MDRSKLSFSEAEGLINGPNVIPYLELNQTIRNGCWNAFYLAFSECVEFDYTDGAIIIEEPLKTILILSDLHFFKHQIDDCVVFKRIRNKDMVFEKIKAHFMNSNVGDFFDFVTFVARQKDCPKGFRAYISYELDAPYSPYRFNVEDMFVFPASTPEQAGLIEEALASITSSGIDGARKHITAAYDYLNTSKFHDAIREAIHAVESAARSVSGKDKATLGDALIALNAKKMVHPALAEGFKKLYAYTNDEAGIRHSHLGPDDGRVGLSEAKFMVSSCAFFCSYLIETEAANQVAKVDVPGGG